MTFSIRSIDTGNASQGKCELIIGDYKEVFPLITTLWSPDAYESQWMEALEALTTGHVDCCVLITDIQPSDVSSGICYWAMFRDVKAVRLQERFSRNQMALLVGPPSVVASHIPPRIQGTPEEHARVSEWEISIEDVCQFLKGLGGRS
jgi:CdiI N-terminal domain